MKIGLVGFPGSGKSTVFGALTGLAVKTGFGGGKANLGVVKVPDPRIDAMVRIFEPKKKTLAEIAFSDLAGGSEGIDRAALTAMREVDALCQVVRAFEDAMGDDPRPVEEIRDLEAETMLADLEIVEKRVLRLKKDRSDPNELALLQRVLEQLEGETALRQVAWNDEERRRLASYGFLSLKPLLLVLNVTEENAAAPAPADVAAAAEQRGLGLVTLSALVEMDIAQMEEEEQVEFVGSLGLEEPARARFIRAAYATTDLISMLTVGPDECRAWPVARGTPAPRAAREIHSDIERGFIRAVVIDWRDLQALGSEAKCREAGKERVEGKEYVIQDGDVIHFRFNV